MIILGIDPSINETGWAVLRTGANYSVIIDGPNQHGFAVADHGVWRPKAKDPYERLRSLCGALDSAMIEFSPTDIVIETTSGKVGKRHKGGGTGLSLYGVAVGGMAMYMQCLLDVFSLTGCQFRLHLVLENLWTGGVPKAKRHAATLAEFGLPKKTTDHETDAIGLVAWWFSHRKLLA